MPCHVLYCDYEGEFKYSDILSRIGFIVDHVRPDALRHVNVGDHQIFVFAYSSDENAVQARQTAERLKLAELPSSILLVHFGTPVVDTHAADAASASWDEIQVDDSVIPLLDALDHWVGTPFPPGVKSSMGIFRGDREKETYRIRIADLEEKVLMLEEKLKQAPSDEAILKPKLQALLKGQKLQFQTEAERLKCQLSELEAQLMDREAKLREFEMIRDKQKANKENE